MENKDKNFDNAKKDAKKTIQPGEMMVAAICFIVAAVILFAFDLLMYFATRGRARAPIIVQSAVCVMFLAISLTLGFAGFAKKNKLKHRRIIEEVCANTGGDKEYKDMDADMNEAR